MHKSLITNGLAALLVCVGYVSPYYGDITMTTGLFALSGGVTNWLAVHMLFEKVPLMYGSGVVPRRFVEFKSTLRALIMAEFFSAEQIERFVAEGPWSAEEISKQVDEDLIFDGIVQVIETSQLGSMLSMVGGRQALEPLREPVGEKVRELMATVVYDVSTADDENPLIGRLIDQIERIIDQRLAELTPEHVKTIVEDIIRQHLGWLVVWGGVVGGLMGLLIAIVSV